MVWDIRYATCRPLPDLAFARLLFLFQAQYLSFSWLTVTHEILRLLAICLADSTARYL